MKRAPDEDVGGTLSGTAAPDSARLDDPRLTRAIEAYLELCETGQVPQRDAFLARYPEFSAELAACLDGLDFVHQVAPHLREQSQHCDSKVTDAVAGRVALGDFRIVRQLGRGGMGVVYEAEQLSLARRVALKVLPFAAMLDEKQLKRFQNEARAAATLDHPNIVSVYSVGTDRGVHYYAMQLIDGQSMAEVIEELRRAQTAPPLRAATVREREQHEGLEGPRGQGVEEERGGQADKGTRSHTEVDGGESLADDSAARSALGVPRSETARLVQTALSTTGSTSTPEFFRAVGRLGIQAAEALDFAHQQGIVHRDVKPGNLMLDARGKLWVTDFGLAQVEDPAAASEGGSRAALTVSGDLIGTLRYMSPEQTLARRRVVDHRSDIYSLGASLYELLTVTPPFPAPDRHELLRSIAFDEPRPPRRLNKAIPAELEIIVLKAIAKDPGERYRTAQELADDLQRFLDDKPIRARRTSLLKRTGRWIRHRQLVAALVLVLFITGLAVTWLTIQNIRTEQFSQRLLLERHQLQLETQEATLSSLRHEVDSLMNRGALQMATGDFDQALHTYTSAIALEGDNPWLYVCRGVARMKAHSGQVDESDFHEASRLIPQWLLRERERPEVLPQGKDARAAVQSPLTRWTEDQLKQILGALDQARLPRWLDAQICAGLGLAFLDGLDPRETDGIFLYINGIHAGQLAEGVPPEAQAATTWARRLIDRAIMRDKDSPLPWIARAAVLTLPADDRSKQAEEAMQSLDRAAELGLGENALLYYLWRAETLMAFSDQLTEPKRSEFPSEQERISVWKERIRENYEAAIQACNKALDLDANSSRAYRTRGNVHRSRSFTFRGWLYNDRERYFEFNEQAIGDYQRALELNPEDVNSRLWLAFCYGVQPQGEEKANGQYDKVLEVAPELVRVHLDRASAYRALGREKEQLAEIDRAIQLAPDWGRAYFERAEFYRLAVAEATVDDRRVNDDEVYRLVVQYREALRQAAQREPSYYLELGFPLAEPLGGNDQQRLEALTAYITKASPKFVGPGAYLMRAELFAKAGQLKQAAADLEVLSDPQRTKEFWRDRLSHFAQALVAASHGRHDQVVPNLVAALEQHKVTLGFLAWFAELYQYLDPAMGTNNALLPPNAIESLRISGTAPSANAWSELYLAMVLHRLGHLDDAHAHYQRAADWIEKHPDDFKKMALFGLAFAMSERGLTAIPRHGSPADKAGLKRGDLILQIDGQSTTGLSIRDATEKLRAISADQVSLTISHQNSDQPEEIVVTRDNPLEQFRHEAEQLLSKE